VTAPNVESLMELLEARTQGSWFVRVERDHYGNEDFYVDTDKGRHWSHIGRLGVCHVEGKDYEKVRADALLMASAPALAVRVLELTAEHVGGVDAAWAKEALAELRGTP
jgi:hypothetical protein